MQSTAIRSFVTAFGLSAFLLLAMGSGGDAPQEKPKGRPIPESPWAGGFVFRYDSPPSSGREWPINIAVVDPYYREEESVFLSSAYAQVGKGFSASMGSDFEKLLVAKGMTASGPFSALDEITYSEKKGAALTFAPRVFITTQVEYDGDWQAVTDGYTRNKAGRVVDVRGERHFTMTINGWISFIMQEPLSGEKMWIKKLEFDPIVQRGMEAYTTVPETTTEYGLFGGAYTTYTGKYLMGNELLYDGKADALASALAQVYPTVMERFWRLVDPEEMALLKEKGKEIRELKVY